MCQTLAFNIVLRYLAGHPQSSVAWLDTNGDFSIDTVRQILDSCEFEVTLEPA